MSDDIILIEDNADDVKLVLDLFKHYGISNTAHVLRDGVEAVNWIESVTDSPALIILDLGLPGVDGVELLRYLKSNLATFNIPIIILTGTRLELNRIIVKVVDGNGYIVKPLTIAAFFEESAKIGLKWRLVKRGK